MNYAKTAISVQRSLKRAGQPVVLTRVSPGAYNPETGTVENGSETFTGSGVTDSYNLRDIDGTNIQQSDQRVYLDPLIGATPQPGDTLTIGGQVFNVVNSKPVSPGGVVVLFECQVRK